ncbi:hypothetical protein BDK51DRAFT_33198 [Blyttiomyces helicus]|uniref:SH3 domain-containing protein n=1 Tax=Blyttiomyces helicus TaxID=388810 RepID=A0A4P9WCS0_9FUNG|nr:hypothetical protein BDK51DRAFT_33198 [Blyttiomyces helicus]|eukprot:RKO90314.1 hypothetical protein BDK51DRAFT_33198 [Blyttiomyces helicus]
MGSTTPAALQYHSPQAGFVGANPVANGGAFHPASIYGPKLFTTPSPEYPSAVGTPAQGFAPPTQIPDPALKAEDLPPTYDENISGEPKTCEGGRWGEAAVSYGPSGACFLVETVVCRETFRDGWVYAINVSENAEGILPISVFDDGKDFQNLS